MTAKVLSAWFKFRTRAHLPGGGAGASPGSAGLPGYSMVRRVWWPHEVMRAPNSPNPARHSLGNPKPGHLPRAHGNGGLGDARGPGGEGSPRYWDPSYGETLTSPDSRVLLWDRSQKKWLQVSHLGCSFEENRSVFYRRKSQTAIGERV